MGKRKLEQVANGAEAPAAKKAKDTSSHDPRSKFGDNLFEAARFEQNQAQYANSAPYKHGVISGLINDTLLRAVRKEIMSNVHFTEKETDIYKIHQSGDLANLDGLDDESLKKLPSLLELRDAMYSAPFREYIAGVTGSGPLSGKKTDMAINVYTPGSHLLCHDDVIGTRRVSYILYLTDPDKAWQAEWGGALRLYPTTDVKHANGSQFKIPDPDFSLSIPPAWNQLSFFTVQPGESFHDVEEVYSSGDAKVDQQRLRMAISGWFHIPQEGEKGYRKEMEKELAASSSLTQLQSKDDFDLPRTKPTPYAEYAQGAAVRASKQPEDPEHDRLSEADADFLLKFMAPGFLTPDAVEELKASFQESSCIRIDGFLSKKFAEALREEINSAPSCDAASDAIEASSDWTVARPPHKQRYLFMLPGEKATVKTDAANGQPTPVLLKQLISEYLPSPQFRKWLRLATGLVLRAHDVKARRFRHSSDYQLATSYDEENPRLEMTLGISPKGKWEAEEAEPAKEGEEAPEVNNGGYEVWMAPDDDDDDGDEDEDAEGPSAKEANGSQTAKPKASDPAIYKSSNSAADDGILFSMPAGWNRLSLVLRDSGTLRFVKYVSRAAGADRWDVVGDWDVDWENTPEFEDGEEIGEEELARELEAEMDGNDDDGDDDDDDGEDDDESASDPDSEDDEEEWNGFSDSDGDGETKAAPSASASAAKAKFGRRRK